MSNYLGKVSITEDPISHLVAKDLRFYNAQKPIRPDQKRNYIDNQDVRAYLQSLDELLPAYDIAIKKK